MKKILFLMLLFFSIKSQCQTIPKNSIDSFKIFTFISEKEPRNNDTVRCLMLLSDTSYGLKPNGFISIINDTIHYDSTYRMPNLKTWYDWGYQVFKWQSDIYNDFHSWKFINYLDSKKQPLGEHIIVWTSQNFK